MSEKQSTYVVTAPPWLMRKTTAELIEYATDEQRANEAGRELLRRKTLRAERRK